MSLHLRQVGESSFFNTTLTLENPYINWRGSCFGRYSQQSGEKCLETEVGEFEASVRENLEPSRVITRAFVDKVREVGLHLIDLYRQIDRYTRSSTELFVYYSVPGVNPRCQDQIQRVQNIMNQASATFSQRTGERFSIPMDVPGVDEAETWSGKEKAE